MGSTKSVLVRLAVLAEDVGVHVLLVDVVVLRDAGAQARGVQDRARADDLLLRQAGDLGEDIRQDVDRVGHDDVDRVGRVLDDLRDDGLGDVDIDLRQLQAGLSGLARDAGGQDDDVGILRVLVSARVDRDGGTEGNALADVQRLAHGLRFIDVDHDDLRGDAVDRHGVGDGGTYAACSDDRNFLTHVCFLHFSSFRLQSAAARRGVERTRFPPAFPPA